MRPISTDFQSWVRKTERDIALLKRQGNNAAVREMEQRIEEVAEEAKRQEGLTPTAPIELVGQTAIYFDRLGFPRGRAFIQHPPVTVSTTGEPVDIDSYELWVRPAGGQTDPDTGETLVERWTRADTSRVPELTADDLVRGAEYEFRTRAIGAFTKPGNWSTTITLTMEQDTTPPRVPTTPDTATSLGVVLLSWDGRFSGGTQGPDIDLEHVRVEVSTDGTTFVDSTQRYGRAGGTIPFVGFPYGEAVFFRLVAVDTSGNESAPSGVANAVPERLVDEDLIDTSITERIDENRQKAEDALSNSIGAQTAAEAAETAAQTAQQQAEAAEQAALDAAGIAAEKGSVIFQISAPTGTRASSQYLWVRKPDMKVHVYDEDQGKWVAATDPDLVQAAQDAAEAKADAAEAKTAAQNAASESEAAKQAARDAQAAADLAESEAAAALQNAQDAYAAADAAEAAAGNAEGYANEAEGRADAAAADALAALQQAQASAGDATAAQTAASAAQAAATTAATQAEAAGTLAADADAKAAQAAADAAQAIADAAAARSAADNAVQESGLARSEAQAAQGAADAAHSTATAANSAAAAAAGIAESKADVLIQSSAPPASMRKATTLWIDTSGGSNTPKRWTSGSTWVAVTDKAATDAAAAAAAASSAAGEAQARADAAHTLAGAAEGNAQAALTSASAAGTAASEAQAAADAAMEEALAAEAKIDRSVNLVNNPSRSGTVDRWAPSSTTHSVTLTPETVDMNGDPVIAMKYTASGNPQMYSDYFDVDPTKAYEIRAWYLDPTPSANSGSQFYFGIHARTADLSIRPVIRVYRSSGSPQEPSTNVYFYNTSGATPQWTELVAYLLPYGTDPSDAAGLGKNVAANAIFATADTTKANLRFLNYNNGSVERDLWLAHITVTETSFEAVRLARDARLAADAAQSAAEGAQSSADLVPKNFFSTNVPSGVAPKHSIWFRVDSSGRVYGQWEQAADGIGSNWQVRQVRSEVIANLDVGKLTAGTGTIVDLEVLNLLRAGILVVGSIDDPIILADGVVTARSVTASEDLSAKVGQFLKVSTGMLEANSVKADHIDGGAVQARHLSIGAVHPENIAIGVDELAPNPTFSNDALWNTPPYENVGPGITTSSSGSHIDPNSPRSAWFNSLSTTASSVPITLPVPVKGGDRFLLSMYANRYSTAGDKVFRMEAEWLDRNHNRIGGDGPEVTGSDPTAYRNYDKVVEAPPEAAFMRVHLTIVSGTTGQHLVQRVSVRRAMSSQVNDWTTQITGRGLEVFSPAGEPSIQLGAFTETGMTLYQEDEGSQVATVVLNDTGEVGGRVVHANESLTYRGEEVGDLLEDSAKGIVARMTLAPNQYSSIGSAGGYLEMAELSALLRPGRVYRFRAHFNASIGSSGSNRGVYAEIRWTKDGTRPRHGGAGQVIARDAYFTSASNTTYYTFAPSRLAHVDESEGEIEVRALLVLRADNRVASIREVGDFDIEDLGLDHTGAYGGIIRNYRVNNNVAPPSDPPAPDPVRTYTKVYNYRWHRTWEQDGTVASSSQNACYQGRTPYYPSAGIYRSMVGLQSMTSDLSGATIKRVRVRVRMDHSHNSGGGTVVIGTHSNSSRPSSFTNTSSDLKREKFSRGQEKWVTLPSSTYSGFRSGSRRGIIFYINSTNTEYYCYMRPDRVAVEVTYEK